MRVEFMKFVDRWAGGFGCFLADLIEFPRRRIFGIPKVGEVKTVLVTKYLGMGSLVLAAPLVKEMRRRFPGARILFLTFEENRPIASMLGLFDEVLTINSRSFSGLCLDTLHALWCCRRAGIDAVFDLEFFTRYSALLAWLSGARIRVGYWSRISWRGDLLTHPVYYNGTKHISRVFMAQLEALGFNWDESRSLGAELPEISADAAAAARLDGALKEAGLDPALPLLLVNPNASELCYERRWMPERFAAAVDGMLDSSPGLQAAFVGSPSEAAYTSQVRGLCKSGGSVANLAGKLDLAMLIEALRRAKLFLTNDSGPLHLATLTRTPTVALFGPETPTLYGPLGANQKSFYAGVYCSPCLNVYNSKTAPCNGNNICMQAFGVDEVLRACREQLAA